MKPVFDESKVTYDYAFCFGLDIARYDNRENAINVCGKLKGAEITAYAHSRESALDALKNMFAEMYKEVKA